MSNLAQKKPDYVFIASLVAIIFVAVYLAMDRFKNSEISGYLHQKGQELLAHIDNSQERENLQSEYNAFLKKVADRDVDPQKVEEFISTIVNLNQTKDSFDSDEFAYLFQKNLQKAVQTDTVKKVYSENTERWNKLQQRLKDLNIFEQKVKEAAAAKSKDKKHFAFSYTIDDTLNIIINEQFKENLEKQAAISGEIKRLEKENALKWQSEIGDIREKQRELQEVLKELNKVKATVSVEVNGDTIKAAIPAAPVVAKPSPTPPVKDK